MDLGFTTVTKIPQNNSFRHANLYFLDRVWRLRTINWEMFGRLVEARIKGERTVIVQFQSIKLYLTRVTFNSQGLINSWPSINIVTILY